MAVVQPYNSQWRDPDFFNIAGTGSTNSNWFDTRKAKTLFVDISMAAAAGATGTFSIQATEFPDLATGIVVVTPDLVYRDSGASTTVTNSTVPYIVAGGSYLLLFNNIPSFCRIRYVFGVAGAAVQAVVMGRAT